MAGAPGPAKLHKEGSSNQLFVLLEEEEDLPRQHSEPSVAPAAALGLQPLGPRLHSLKQDMRRCGCTALVAAGVATLVSGVLITVGGPWLGHAPPEKLLAPQQKSIVIGSKEVPGALLLPPQPELVTVGHPAYHCRYGMSPSCPARELFSSSELHEVATENLMQVGHGILVHADRDRVRATVAAGFRNLSRQLDTRAPAAAATLAGLELSEPQKNAVLSSMRLMSIPEVQRIGFEVALAIRRSLSVEREVIQRQIEDMLKSNLGELERVRDEMVPESVLEFWQAGPQWEMSLAVENVLVMEAFHGGKFFGSMNASFYADSLPTTPKRLPAEEKVYGAWGGVVEEGRALLEALRLIARSSGVKLDVPPAATSLRRNIDLEDLGSELLSCELHEGKGMNNLMKAFFCPLKYGTQGMDALRAVDQMLRPSRAAA